MALRFGALVLPTFTRVVRPALLNQIRLSQLAPPEAERFTTPAPQRDPGVVVGAGGAGFTVPTTVAGPPIQPLLLLQITQNVVVALRLGL